MSSNFLIILLDFIEKWSLTFPNTEFEKTYYLLVDKNVKFPSQFKKK